MLKARFQIIGNDVSYSLQVVAGVGSLANRTLSSAEARIPAGADLSMKVFSYYNLGSSTYELMCTTRK